MVRWDGRKGVGWYWGCDWAAWDHPTRGLHATDRWDSSRCGALVGVGVLGLRLWLRDVGHGVGNVLGTARQVLVVYTWEKGLQGAVAVMRVSIEEWYLSVLDLEVGVSGNSSYFIRIRLIIVHAALFMYNTSEVQ